MATRKINITGVQGGRGQGTNNQMPARMEINTYLQDADRKTILLLGLERMQARPHSDMKSWYQIAGIHGRPYTVWDGEGRNGQKPGGYCTHSSVLFLSWHRPYLALAETVLYEDIQTAVKAFPAGAKRDRLAAAAVTFRLPYWDWASKPAIHPLILQKTVQVEKPTGTVTIPNPLYSYRFQNTNDFPPGKYRNWTQTLRHPLTDSSMESQDAILTNIKTDIERRDTQDRFGGRRGPWINLRERIWHLLNVEQNRYPTYAAFSNDRWVVNGRSSDYDSIESVHNSLHGMIGGSGHMGDPGYAGFDPIFWLHHCNIDRMWALWQALHPEDDMNWDFGIKAETEHTFHWWSGTKEEENTPLVPFHRTDSAYWTSNDCRDFKTFGYTYPELADWNVPNVSRAQLRTKVAASVKTLYANQTTAGSLLNAARSSAPAGSPFISLASAPGGDMPPLEPRPGAAAPTAASTAASNAAPEKPKSALQAAADAIPRGPAQAATTPAPQQPLHAAAAPSGSTPRAGPHAATAASPAKTHHFGVRDVAAAVSKGVDAATTGVAKATEAAKAAAPPQVRAAIESVERATSGPLKAAGEAIKKTAAAYERKVIELDVPISTIVKNNSHREYFANIRAPKYSFNGSYVVHVFLGPFTEDYRQRPFDPNLVGSLHVFANNIETTGCENCKKNAEQNLAVTGSVPLTSALLERIAEVGSLEQQHVEPYLKQNLHWRIHHNDEAHGNVDRRTCGEDLKVAVTSVVVEHPATPDGIPIYRDWNPIPGITEGRPTGAGYDDAEGYEG